MVLLLVHKAVVVSKEPWLAALQLCSLSVWRTPQHRAQGWARPASSRATIQLWLSHSNPSSHERPSHFFSAWDYLALKSTTVSSLEGAHGGFPKLKPYLTCLERKQQQQQQSKNFPTSTSTLWFRRISFWLGSSRAICSSTPGLTLGASNKNLQVFRSIVDGYVHSC